MAATYTLISSTTLAAQTNQVTFSSIPSTYRDLVVRWSVRTAGGATTDSMRIWVNNDVNSSYYTNTYLVGNGSAGGSSARNTNGINYIFPWQVNANGSTTGFFSNSEFYLANYSQTTQKRGIGVSIRETMDTDNTAIFLANRINYTSVINRIDLNADSNFLVSSSFYLYGIKNT